MNVLKTFMVNTVCVCSTHTFTSSPYLLNVAKICKKKRKEKKRRSLNHLSLNLLENVKKCWLSYFSFSGPKYLSGWGTQSQYPVQDKHFPIMCNLHLLKLCLIVTWNISTPRRQNLLMLKFESWVLGQNCDAVAYFSLWYFIVVFVTIFTWYWCSLRIEMMRRCVDKKIRYYDLM